MAAPWHRKNMVNISAIVADLPRPFHTPLGTVAEAGS
jgi:hypothetical protein